MTSEDRLPLVVLLRHPFGWNYRYLAYAAMFGRGPEAQRENDYRKWPGGVNAGFTLWVQRMWLEWDIAAGRIEKRWRPHDEVDHDDFDLWLAFQVAGVESGAYMPPRL